MRKSLVIYTALGLVLFTFSGHVYAAAEEGKGPEEKPLGQRLMDWVQETNHEEVRKERESRRLKRKEELRLEQLEIEEKVKDWIRCSAKIIARRINQERLSKSSLFTDKKQDKKEETSQNRRPGT